MKYKLKKKKKNSVWYTGSQNFFISVNVDSMKNSVWYSQNFVMAINVHSMKKKLSWCSQNFVATEIPLSFSLSQSKITKLYASQ